MCGFVTIINKYEPVCSQLLAKMRDNLTHRGPDAAGEVTYDRFGFGHRRLSIVDPGEQSDQPMVSPDRRYVLNYNGEIYNYIELREELRADGYSFRTESDTEVLLAALTCWGLSALPRLNGMFGFTFWDAVEQTLLMARDRFGEKPFFYHQSELKGLIAASEMKAILADPSISDAIDEESLAAYQAGSYYEDGASTLFAHIKRLPPAHYAIADSKGAIKTISRYWTPDYDHIDRKISRADAVEEFGRLFRQSVTRRLRSDVPVGSSLSGGLDSSAIVGVISRARSAGIASTTQNTFSAVFDDDPSISEGEFIDDVVNYTNVKSYRVTPDPELLLEEMRRLHWHQEEPFLSASIYLQYCVARIAKENDTTVLLDGQGADELLGGYQFYYRNRQIDLLDQRRYAAAMWQTWLFNRRLKVASRGYAESRRRFDHTVALSALSLINQARVERPVYGGAYTVGVPPLRPGSRIRRQMAEALQYNCLPQLLRYADRNSMAFSRESRLPFLDTDLVDFTLTLPDDILFHKAWQKYPLRAASAGYIPKSVTWRADKVGYAAPLDRWMRGSMKGWAEDRLFNGAAAKLDGFDAEKMRELWDAHQNSAQNNSWAFWRWISLSEWLDMRSRGDLRRNLLASEQPAPGPDIKDGMQRA
ncbi:asparagine synthase (glutamine-hydrolyzing) [Hoeflea sp. YIM 152468]|uniref:asparagine synthase (glutamine-hydrolyzing) n=1 Tax=Hoeflea sp. YIM 152468 TaxID=3031759 RepID=UPI0023DC0D70|nr:asparagine synthase (glutamine-hydrolyzing) [Hoeflea sp. YIM 152468]MDF1610268.1 asparagine synthase (glutamine-hydrolyzing) [Hoeflea sp. YIM 152468]